MRYAKAVIGALITGLGTLATALSDNAVAPVEWIWVAIATLTALGGVAWVPNRRPEPIEELADRSVARAELEERIGHLPPPGQHRRTRPPD